MFGRYTRITFITIFSIVLFGVLVSSPAQAALERYTWKDYKTIQGESGAYGVIAKTGGTPTTAFPQNNDAPTTFTASEPSDSCKGSLIITLNNSDTKGALTSSGACSPFQDADKTISIGSRDVAEVSVENEEKQMLDAYNMNACNSTNQQISTDCLDENTKKTAAMQTQCLSESNYKQNVSTGNAYLDCMSKALDVPRPGADKPVDDSKPDECTIMDTGWIICQMNLFIASLTDFTFTLLKPFLYVTPFSQEVEGVDASTFTAWKTVRTFANIILVIVFMVIIYSQITGTGVSVYNIKRMLPRLVVAAFLINTSFILCSIAIDASNVVGATIQNVIKTMDAPTSSATEYGTWESITKKIQSTGATTAVDDQNNPDKNADPNQPNAGGAPSPDPAAPADPNAANAEDDLDAGTTLTKMTVGGMELTGIAVMFVQLSALVPIMVMALFALLTVLLVLLVRTALIIILVVISPLAFACILLPNTQRWFNRWREIFTDMMILYPAVAIVFGASSLASNVIRKSAEENGQVLLAIFSLGIQVIPLFIAPLLIKISGGVLSQFAGVVNNKKKGVYDRSMGRAQDFRDGRKAIRQMNAARGTTLFGAIKIPGGKDGRLNNLRPINRKAVRKKTRDLANATAENMQQKFYADNAEAINDRAMRGIDDATARAASEALAGIATTKLDDIELEETKAAVARFRNDTSISPDSILNAIESRELNGKRLSEAEYRAAIRLAGERFNDADGIERANRIVAQSGSMSINERRELISTLRANKVGDRAAYLSGSGLGAIESGSINGQEGINKLVQSAANGGKFSQQALANSSATTLDLINQNMGALKPEAATQLKADAAKTLTNRNLSASIRTDSRSHLEVMAR